MTSSTVIEVKGVSKTFHQGTPNENHVLNNIRFSAQEGDFITIIGGNGAGKSTLLNTVSGSILADKGSILLKNNEITRAPEEKRAADIARVFQDPLHGTAPRMTIAENLALALRRGEKRLFKKNMTKQNREYFQSLLSKVGTGLEQRLDTEVGQLSGGQRQVIAMLMATIKRPSLLLLDEHTAALDPKAAETVMKLTDEKIKADNLTALMITHNMKQAIQYGNRLMMMKSGEIILDIQAEEKKQLTVERLLSLFQEKTNDQDMTDRMFLA